MDGIGLQMLWEVFGASLDRVSLEDVSNLTEQEVEVFTCLRHHSIETSLALASRNGVPPAQVKSERGQSEDALLGQIDKVARACQTVAELTAVEALRHQMYKDANSVLRAKCQDHERRIRALEEVAEEVEVKKRRKQKEVEKKRREEEKRKRNEEERVRLQEEEKVSEAERRRKEDEERRKRVMINDSKIMNEQGKIKLTGFFAEVRDQIKECNLLFRASEHGFTPEAFH